MDPNLDASYHCAMVEAVECTAFDTTATNDRNPLMTPPCACPRCAPPPVEISDDGRKAIWLPVRGRPVRFEVDDLELGRTGHDVLG